MQQQSFDVRCSYLVEYSYSSIEKKQFFFQMSSIYQASINPVVSMQSSAQGFMRKEKRPTLQGCQKANLQLALQNVKKLSNRYHHDEEISCNVDVEYFKKYGPGIYLFFTFTKKVSILFTIMTMIYLVGIVFNYYKGSGFSSMVSSLGTYLAQTTVGNLNSTPQSITSLDSTSSKNYKLFNAVPDLAASFLFLLFYLYWEYKSDKLTEQVKRQVKFQSFSTLELLDFPQNVTEQELHAFFSQFGQVKQVAPVKNYSEIVNYSKEIYECQLAKKDLLFANELDRSDEEKVMKKVGQLDEKIADLSVRISYEQQCQNEKIFKYYIAFKEPRVRQIALKELSKHHGCCKWGTKHIPPEHLIHGEKIKVRPCHNEPGDIIWENQHIVWTSRIARTLLQALLLIILISITFLMISFLNIATPTTSTTIDTNQYTGSTIQAVTNTTILYVWCIKNSDFANSVPPIKALCNPYLTRYYLGIAIGVLISLVVVGVKVLLKKIVIFLAKFQRYKEYTEQSMGIMSNLFYTYLCTTVLITLLLQANIFGISFKTIIAKFIKNQYLLDNVSSLTEYSDFNPFWYLDIGYKISLTWIILAFQAPLLAPIISFLNEKFNNWRAGKQLTQKGMENKMMPEVFQIEDHYANMMLIIFVGLTFSSGMPFIIIPCSFALIFRYFSYKIMFIRFSKLPKSLDEAMNEKILNMLPFALLLHFLFGVWMLGCESVFVTDIGLADSLLSSDLSFLRSIGFLVVRFSSSWYYTVVFFVCLGIVLIKMLFYDLIFENLAQMRDEERIPTAVLSKQGQQTQIVMVKKKSEHPEDALVENITSQKTLTASYRIENNPDYYEVLAIMGRLTGQSKTK